MGVCGGHIFYVTILEFFVNILTFYEGTNLKQKPI
jgi:hypothetical protein